MSPQFVDFNGDGKTDIVAGIFDGSPHVAFGDGEHFGEVQQILDKDGARIVMNQFWNFDTKKWDKTDRCDPEGGAPAEGHLTSAWAFDWDHDGDLDLLLGDHSSGLVMLRRNEGTAAAPKFAARNEVVKADGEPLVVAGTVTTLRTIDWNGDGKQDLLVGSMGDPYGDDTGGGVFVHLGVGDGEATAFGPKVTLIPASTKDKAHEPKRPDAGLYMDAVDYDGDGDLDLVVGGYSMWSPPTRKLTEAQKTTRDELKKRIATLNKHQHDFFEKLQHEAGDLETEAGQKRYQELFEKRKSDLDRVNAQLKKAEEQLQKLEPKQQRRSFVWLYENLARS